MVPRLVGRSPEVPVHGGDLDAIGSRYAIDPAELLDFSANLNPLGPPASLLRELSTAAADVKDLTRYPARHANALRSALANKLDVDPEAIVVANGAAAVLGIALKACRVRTCVVPVPAFSEDRHAVLQADAAYRAVPLEAARGFALEPESVLAAMEDAAADACLITNPHNPSGALTSRAAMLALYAEARKRSATIFVDEAFIDFVEHASISRDAASLDRLVTIRSLTKIFAVPALRVGYAVCRPDLARRFHASMPSWPVTTLAARALTAALAEVDFIRETILRNERERDRLSAEASALGFGVTPAAANFLLLQLPPGSPNAPECTERLILESRVVVRDCSSYEGLEDGRHVRVAIRLPAENDRLVAALRRLRS